MLMFRPDRVFENGTLFIGQATASHEGTFLCKADNGIGQPISKLASLNVNGKINELNALHRFNFEPVQSQPPLKSQLSIPQSSLAKKLRSHATSSVIYPSR